jgi:hypothetical protein
MRTAGHDTGRRKARQAARPRPRLADLGFHRLTVVLLAFQFCTALLVICLFVVMGLSANWRGSLSFVVMDSILVGVWIYLWRVPGPPREWRAAESVLAMLLTIGLTHVLTPAQYVAVAFDRPLIDPVLARADALMGVDVPSLVRWSRAHPAIDLVWRLAYFSFIVQLVLIPPIVGVFLADRRALWEYVFNFHFCGAVTVVCLALFPAACAFQFYGFESTINQTRFITHFNGLRDGSFTRINFNDMEGLISMPSFHVAGALMVIWSLRRNVKVQAPLLVLNGLLILSTVMTGAHYAVDLLATAVLFAASIYAWRHWGAPLLDAGSQNAEAAQVEQAT